MSVTQKEMEKETKANNGTSFENPFDSKYVMSEEDIAKVFTQNRSETESDSEETLSIVDGAALTVSEQQDELIREYLLAVIASRRSSIHHTIIDAAGFIINDGSFAHEDAVEVLKTITKYFQDKYVRQ